MKDLTGVKYSAAGNTIILILESFDQKIIKKTTAQKLCDSTRGPGADGVLYLKKDQTGETDYIWDFYNADGSTAEMCGNAARSATQFCFEELKLQQSKVKFKTLSGQIACEKTKSGQFVVEMPKIKIKENEIQLSVNNGTEKFLLVDTGVPHLVIEKKDLVFNLMKDLQIQAWAKSLRHHLKLAPSGANVTLVSFIDKKKQAVTFERGVENFTLACGTGAVAAAIYFENKNSEGRHEIYMPGGSLNVDLTHPGRPLLTGTSEKVKKFTFEGDPE